MQKYNRDKAELYPYELTYNGRKIIFIWQTGAKRKDSFLLNSKKNLISAKSEKALKKLLGNKSREIQWREGAKIDFDKFWKIIENLREGKSSSKRTCALLLDGWNFIEDLLRTFKLNRGIIKLRSPFMNKVYDKLFWGTNLPAATPEGSSYSPIWIREEIISFRQEIRSVWKMLERRAIDTVMGMDN